MKNHAFFIFLFSSFLIIAGCPSVESAPETKAPQKTAEKKAPTVEEKERIPDAGTVETRVQEGPSKEESAATPLPDKIVILSDPSPDSTLNCPEGARQFSTDNSVWCAKPPALGGMPERHGPMIGFHPDGKVNFETHALNGKTHGQNWRYRPDGSLERFGQYKNGKLHGLRADYFSNGQRYTESFYKDGKEHGVFKRWNDQGNLVSLTTYENGRQISQKFFHQHASEMPTDPEVQDGMRQVISDMLEHASPEERELMKEGMKDLMDHLDME